MSNPSKYYVLALLFFSTAINASQRTFTIKNYCNEPVWFGVSGASLRNAHSPTDTTCGGDGDCLEGSKCIQTGPIRQCFWINPEPADGDYKLAPGQSKDINMPIINNGIDIIWSGTITGRTNCNSNGCEKADCGNSDKGCKPSQGFMQPATQAEFTLAKQGVDFYDIEVINGFHMPVSMSPTNAAGTTPYKCGNPGSKYPRTKVGACNWDLSPPSAEYNWVTAGGNSCQSDADCNGDICGLSFNPGHAILYVKTCGKRLGYLTADQVCGVVPSFGEPFNCQAHAPAPFDYLTNWNLYGCVGTGSCYQDGAAESCCGCANWDEEGVPVPPFPDTERCKNKNHYWNDKIKGTLLWLKKACPTAYIYPFDDMSSTFTCTNNTGLGTNMVNYEVAFCPQNEQRQAEFVA